MRTKLHCRLNRFRGVIASGILGCVVSVAAVVVSADPPGPSAGDDTAKPSVPRGDVAIPPGTEDEPAGGAGSGNPVYSDLTANALLSGPVRTVDGKPAPEQLLARFIDRHSALDYPAAAEAALHLVEAAPDRPISHYNLACVMAKLNRPEAA